MFNVLRNKKKIYYDDCMVKIIKRIINIRVDVILFKYFIIHKKRISAMRISSLD